MYLGKKRTINVIMQQGKKFKMIRAFDEKKIIIIILLSDIKICLSLHTLVFG